MEELLLLIEKIKVRYNLFDFVFDTECIDGPGCLANL